MKIYKVQAAWNQVIESSGTIMISRVVNPEKLIFIVDNVSEVEPLYRKKYPGGGELKVIELIDGEIINKFEETV